MYFYISLSYNKHCNCQHPLMKVHKTKDEFSYIYVMSKKAK